MSSTAPAAVVGLTMGDPAGIGPEIIVKAHRDITSLATPVVIGDATTMEQACEVCEQDLRIRPIGSPAEASRRPDTIDVLDLDNVSALNWGEVDEAYGRASLDYIETAIELAQAGAIDAIVTAPIHKQAVRLAGGEHAGHTGLLAARTGTERYAMMLIEGPLRVTHLSTHVPLREACDLVTEASVFETIKLTAEALRDLHLDDPQLAVAGLNPHAGEGGVLGETDDREIAPAVSRAEDAGIDVEGPEPPDTIFARAAGGAFDCVVAMYHDQGHIPIKMLGFSDSTSITGVNVTIGLPIVRTSVDHGTAFDIAGSGQASPTSLVQAVEVATEIAAARGDRLPGRVQ